MTNTSSNTTEDIKPLEWPLYIYLYMNIFYIAIFLIGVTGNVLVIFVMWRNSSLRSPTNLLLMNLAIVDLLVLLFCMPSGLMEFYTKEIWYLGEFMCSFTRFLETVFISISIFTILAIGLERYVAVCWPLKAHYLCTRRITVKIIIATWLAGIKLCWPYYLCSGLVVDPGYPLSDGTIVTVHICETTIDHTWKKVYITIWTAFLLPFPMAVLVVLYVKISHRLKTKLHLIEVENAVSATVTSKRRKVVRMLIAVVTLFFISLLPLVSLTLWEIYSTQEEMHQLSFFEYYNLKHLIKIIFYMNSTCNPIVYTILSSNFRNSFKRMCCKGTSTSQLSQNSNCPSTVLSAKCPPSIHKGIVPEERYAMLAVKES